MPGVARWCTIFMVALGALLVPHPVRAADPWLFVNDVHFDPASRERRSVTSGDTNAALLDSALSEMRRLAPNPPVIVMAGDFLSHDFKPASAEPTMVALARRFDRAFPHAQFVIAMGNEDSACGDYGIAPNSRLLRTVATAWAPLVNRNGAAPDFVRTFPRDGFYTAKLPLPGIRAVIVDDAFWSALYHNGCRVPGNPTSDSFGELDRALRPAENERRWLVMHIPPGIDVDSTLRRAHHLAIVPFLRPGPRDAVLALIGDPARRIELVISGHVHRFGFRIVGRNDASPDRAVPLLVAPAISPIFGNAASFLTADVGADGVIHNLEEHSFVEGRWRDMGGLSSLGVSAFSGPALANLQRRLEHDPELREKFARLYDGGDPRPQITARTWRSYWCGASEFSSTAFRDCLDEGGFGFLTRRGVAVVAGAIGGALIGVAAAVTLVVVLLRRRRAARPASRSKPRP